MSRPWTDPQQPEEDRMLKFERWLTAELRQHIEWPEGPAGEKLLFQVREVIRAQLRVLADRGWLLDQKPLAQFLSKPIQDVGRAQKTGHIRNLYTYCCRKFCRYVDERAEEIQDYTTRIGHSIRNLDRTVRSIPELEAERHTESVRERMQKRRQQQQRKDAAKAQQTLF